MANEIVTQKRILVVPDPHPWGGSNIWQIQLKVDKYVTTFSTATNEQMTTSLVKEAMQHYIDVANKPENKERMTAAWAGLIQSIIAFMDTKDIEITNDSSKWIVQ